MKAFLGGHEENGIQLNKYETAPYFFLLNQNLTENCSVLMFKTILGSDQANSVKNTHTNNRMSSFGLIEKKI